MLARTPSTFTHLKLIGVIAAATAIAGGSLRAQTLADLGDRATFIERQCGHILDATQRVGCGGQASIDFDNARTATAKQGIATEHQLQRCGEFLRAKRGEGVLFDRKITRDNMCPYARELGMRDGPG